MSGLKRVLVFCVWQEATDDEDGYDDDEDEDDGGEGGDSDGSGLGHHLNAFKEAVGESAPEARDDGPITEVPSDSVPNIEEPSEIGPVVETPSENGPVVEKPSESGPVIEKPGESGPVIEKPSECRPVVKAKPTFTEHVEPSAGGRLSLLIFPMEPQSGRLFCFVNYIKSQPRRARVATRAQAGDHETAGDVSRLKKSLILYGRWFSFVIQLMVRLRAKRAKITDAAVVPASAGPTGFMSGSCIASHDACHFCRTYI